MSHHQMQYKDENIDYLFINIHSFLRNCLSGDSTINFEIINSDKLINTELEFLYKNKKTFYNYKILRSYLGLAKRDIKRINIDGKDNFGRNKKVAHAYRGLVSAVKIMNNRDIELTLDEINFIKEYIWKFDDYVKRFNYTKTLISEIEECRKYMNEELKITKFMKTEDQIILDSELNNLLKTTSVEQMSDFDMTEFYEANENDIKY